MLETSRQVRLRLIHTGSAELLLSAGNSRVRKHMRVGAVLAHQNGGLDLSVGLKRMVEAPSGATPEEAVVGSRRLRELLHRRRISRRCTTLEEGVAGGRSRRDLLLYNDWSSRISLKCTTLEEEVAGSLNLR
jgi:hypothetical protein